MRLLASLFTATCNRLAHRHHESRSSLYAAGILFLFTFLDIDFREHYSSSIPVNKNIFRPPLFFYVLRQ
jgi:hypothetical protein